jgi:hypothetical protein
MALEPSRSFGCSPARVRQFGKTAPEGERLLEAGHSFADVAGGGGIASQPGCRFVTPRIDFTLGEGPTRPRGEDVAIAERATQCGDVGLQGFGGGAWRVLAPEQFDECGSRDHRSAVQPQHREDGARFGARDRDGRTVSPDLERP